MARTPQQAMAGLLQLWPTGEVIWSVDEDSYIRATYLPWATELALIEAQAEGMQLEIDPRTAVFTLDAFERVLGPDPCGRDGTDSPATCGRSVSALDSR